MWALVVVEEGAGLRGRERVAVVQGEFEGQVGGQRSRGRSEGGQWDSHRLAGDQQSQIPTFQVPDMVCTVVPVVHW